MLFDPIACGDSHLLSSPHAVGGDPEVWVSGGFETRPYGFFGAARRAAAGYLSLLVQRKSICFSRIACGDVEQLSCGSRAAGGLLFFACAKKSNQKVCPKRASLRGPDIRISLYIKAHPVARRTERRAVPCVPRLSRALRNSHESKITIRAQTVLAHIPGLSCGTRRAPTGWRIKNQNRARSAHNQDVAVDVGTRSRRRASQPRPGGVASRCLSRARLFALGEFGSRPAGARSAGGFRRLRGVLSLGYLSLHEQRKVTRRRAASGRFNKNKSIGGLWH